MRSHLLFNICDCFCYNTQSGQNVQTTCHYTFKNVNRHSINNCLTNHYVTNNKVDFKFHRQEFVIKECTKYQTNLSPYKESASNW